MKTVSFASVVYRAYRPAREQARAVIREGRFSLVVEYPEWDQLFQMLDRWYPELTYEIPDEIEVLILDRNFKRVES
jgi:hypothetical protein